jgi:hypothetical protein
MNEEEFLKEAKAYVEAVINCGTMSSVAMGQFARLRTVYEGKPAAGKWAKWAEHKDRKEGIIP